MKEDPGVRKRVADIWAADLGASIRASSVVWADGEYWGERGRGDGEREGGAIDEALT